MRNLASSFLWLLLAVQPLALPADAGADCPYAIVYYSGQEGNQDVFLLPPGEKEPHRLTDHPGQDLCPAPSPDGERIVFLSDRGGPMDIYSMKSDGSDVRRLTATPEDEEHPEFTPDGRRVLFVRDFEKRTEIWIMNADGTKPQRLTRNEARDERPFMSPDGSRILFMSNRDGNYEIYTMEADGGRQKRLTHTPEWEIFPAWSPDGREIAYARKFRADGRMQGMIRVMSADGSNDRAITAVGTRDENAMWSPDGRFIVFQSVRDGNFEIYRARRDGRHPVRLTHHPAWDGWASFVPCPSHRLVRPAEIQEADEKADAHREPLLLTRVANSGVMLASGTTKVLIDSLFDMAPSDYRSPDPAVLDKIMKGEEPFDGVRLALVTHNHPDHFSAPLAVRFLEAHPGAMLSAPEDAVAEMRKELGWPHVASRIVPLDLKIGEKTEREIAGVPLAACRTLHSGKREEPMNLMLQLRLNGWNVFHEGDADATIDEYRGFGLAEAKIDLALVHFWFPLHPEMARLLQEVVRPAHIGLTHLPIRLEGDAPGKIDMVRQRYKDVFLLLPGMPAKTFNDEAQRAADECRHE